MRIKSMGVNEAERQLLVTFELDADTRRVYDYLLVAFKERIPVWIEFDPDGDAEAEQEVVIDGEIVRERPALVGTG